MVIQASALTPYREKPTLSVLWRSDGEADHIHLLVEYSPTVALSKLINSLKGAGARLLLRDRADMRRQYAQGDRRAGGAGPRRAAAKACQWCGVCVSGPSG